MRMYSNQWRHLVFSSSARIAFPNTAVIEVKLGPGEQFGTAHGYSRFAIYGEEGEAVLNLDSGHYQVKPKRAIDQWNVKFCHESELFTLEGDICRYETYCRNEEELFGCAVTLMNLLPCLLNVKFPDPPVVLSVDGKLGTEPFQLRRQEIFFPIYPKKQHDLVKHINRCFECMYHENLRIHKACCYMHVASRLLVAGQSMWEFMPEFLLNACKALQVLFGEKMDEVRAGLHQLGYTDDEIEGDFIPVMVLRNHFDVGHAQISFLSSDKLPILFKYLLHAEERVKDLIIRVIDNTLAGSGTISGNADFEPAAETKKKFDQLLVVMQGRVAGMESSS